MACLFIMLKERLIKMKYCPYCGAALVGEKVMFCVECGKELPIKVKERSRRHKKKSIKRKKKKNSESKLHQDAKVNDGYDGYYDDVMPEDQDFVAQGMDMELIKKAVALAVCALLIIFACVAIMYML